MKRIALALALTMGLPSVASATGWEGRALRYSLGTLIDNKALNAAAATRTTSVSLNTDKLGYDVAVFHIDYTNSAATTVTMSCEIQPSATTTDAVMQSCAVSAGLCTSTNASWSNAVSGDEVFLWRVDVSGYPGTLECTFAGASAGAGDLVTVTGWLVTK